MDSQVSAGAWADCRTGTREAPWYLFTPPPHTKLVLGLFLINSRSLSY